LIITKLNLSFLILNTVLFDPGLRLPCRKRTSRGLIMGKAMIGVGTGPAADDGAALLPLSALRSAPVTPTAAPTAGGGAGGGGGDGGGGGVMVYR
jgi:hypothetical protein